MAAKSGGGKRSSRQIDHPCRPATRKPADQKALGRWGYTCVADWQREGRGHWKYRVYRG